jgi:hypothetical protein
MGQWGDEIIGTKLARDLSMSLKLIGSRLFLGHAEVDKYLLQHWVRMVAERLRPCRGR